MVFHSNPKRSFERTQDAKLFCCCNFLLRRDFQVQSLEIAALAVVLSGGSNCTGEGFTNPLHHE